MGDGPGQVKDSHNVKTTAERNVTNALKRSGGNGDNDDGDRVETEQESSESDEGPPPPLPPRPGSLAVPIAAGSSTLQIPTIAARPKLHTQATTALSSIDIHTHTYQDGTRENYTTSSARLAGTGQHGGVGGIDRYVSRSGSEAGDTSSVRSYAPTLSAAGDVESLLGEVLNGGQSPAWKLLGVPREDSDPFDAESIEDKRLEVAFDQEFDELPAIDEDGGNEEALIERWRGRLKHFIILSSAGKPIYSRHGDQNLISSYIGVIQTIISFYEGVDNPLKSFTAGPVRFVIMTEGPLHLVAISRLPESDAQLRVQLEALYMQVLSTLTLPALTHIFSSRPSSDLRQPLEGTGPLLSALADSFTRGSPSTLLSALECLTLRTTHRQAINSILLQHRTPDLLYGLIVAGGRLVSVIRPRKHSLHPSDLLLIFNMLFQSGGVHASGGESWIPLCLPGFNKSGYLHMYVSFLPSASTALEDRIAIILISPSVSAFFPLRAAHAAILASLTSHSPDLLALIRAAVAAGRKPTTEIVPGTVIRHFLYKSRANVQFFMPALAPQFAAPIARRRLLSAYHLLHASMHARYAPQKVQHRLTTGLVGLAWITPTFEFYAVAGAGASRAALAQGANRVVGWVGSRGVEERVFILGGAVF